MSRSLFSVSCVNLQRLQRKRLSQKWGFWPIHATSVRLNLSSCCPELKTSSIKTKTWDKEIKRYIVITHIFPQRLELKKIHKQQLYNILCEADENLRLMWFSVKQSYWVGLFFSSKGFLFLRVCWLPSMGLHLQHKHKKSKYIKWWN